MTPEEFEKTIQEEFPRAVPEKFHHLLENIAFIVEDEPDAETRKEQGLERGETLLGLYRGIPHTARGDYYGVGPTLPDTITLYRLPIQRAAEEDGLPIARVIRETIWHEVAHAFGYDEEQVRGRENEEGMLP